MASVKCNHEEYEVLMTLKQTHASIIFLAKNKENKKVLIKMAIKESFNNLMKNECIILSKLKHKYVQDILNCCNIGLKAVIIMSYYENYQPLHKKKNLDLIEIIRVITMLLEAVEYIHKNNIVHRDIKPPNILVSPDAKDLKLIDFATAINLNDPRYAPKKVYSLGGFTSPEQYNLGGAKFQYDIWSICSTILYLMTKELPFFFFKNYPTLETKIDTTLIKTVLTYLYNRYIAEELTDILHKGLIYGSRKGFKSVSELKESIIKIFINLDTDLSK